MNLLRFLNKNHRPLFFGVWLLVNLIQAATTELFDDEAYYWLYSQYPAWGYFDHPPMIAWLIKAGSAIFPGELGVRFFIVLMNTGTIFLIWKLLERKNDCLFYAIAASIAVAQIGGIIAVPDIPLLFFVALFFWQYKRYIQQPLFGNGIMLGIVMALMLYSKYHGVLIVLFTIISNPGLLRKASAYIAVLVAIVLFAPHLYWQYTHNFPSVQFHLFERNAVSYRFSFTSEYLLGQIALAGPLIGWLFIWAALKYKPANLTERAMKFSLIGIYLVFLLSTLKGRVEANWTVPAFVGLMVLSHQWLMERPGIIRWVYRSVPITLLIVFAGRIYMMLDVPVSPLISKDEFHENLTTTKTIQQLSKNLPVVVIDSYQKPSKQIFYTNQKAFSLNTPWYRRNNFNYWPIEDSLIGKPVYAIGSGSEIFNDSIPSVCYKNKKGVRIDNYFSFSKIRINNIREELVNSSIIQFTCNIETPAHYLPLVQKAPYDTASIVITIYNKRGDVLSYLPTSFKVNNIREEKMQTTIVCNNHGLAAGWYSVRLGISSCLPGYPSLNSSNFRFEVK